MALTFNVQRYVSDAPTGLVVTPVGALGALIQWDPVDAGDLVEIWWNSSNDSGTAELIARTQDKCFVDKDFNNNYAGSNNYYWLKRIQANGQPSGFTSSYNVNVSALGITGAWSTTSTGSASGTATLNDTWQYIMNVTNFYTPKTSDMIVAHGVFPIDFTWTPTSGQDWTIDYKFELYDYTSSAVISSATMTGVWKDSYARLIKSCPIVPFNINSSGSVTPGHQYVGRFYYRGQATGSPSVNYSASLAGTSIVIFN